MVFKGQFRTVRYIALAVLVLIWQIAGWPKLFGWPPSSEASAAPVVYVVTSGSTWSVPSSWNDADNTIEAIGAGGNGSSSTASADTGAGGGGGEYAEAVNVSLTPSTNVNINIPSGGAGSSSGTWLENNSGTIVSEAMDGGNASGTTAGSGGTGGVGSTLYNGGAGGKGATGAEGSGAGGGGSAGPVGAGQAGAAGGGGTKTGGGGGGGSDGGSSSAGGAYSGTTGGGGGNGTSGSGGGSGGTSNSNNAAPGTNGGGGGGGGEGSGSGTVPGASGGSESLWGSGEGPSGGGGGGGGAGGTSATGSKNGGTGGTYGGGGGGAGLSGSHTFTGGTGGQGILIITNTPATPPSVSQNDYRLFNNPSSIGSTPWQDCSTQGGYTSIPADSASSTLTLSTPITNLSEAFLLVNATGDSSVTAGEDHLVAGAITNSTTLTFTRGDAAAGGVAQVSYSLIECYNGEFSVQSGTSTITSGNSSTTATINSVNSSQSMVLTSVYDDDSSANEANAAITGSLQDSSTLYFERSGTPSVNATIEWQVVTFSSFSQTSVQSGSTLLAAGDSTVTQAINSVNTGSSWVYCNWDSDTNTLSADAVGCDLSSSTSLTFSRYASESYNNNVQWFVVSFPSAQVSVQSGAQTDSGGSTDGVEYDIQIPISTIDSTARAFAYITNTTSGTGTAYPRDDWIEQLTSTSNLETSYWRGSSSGSGTHYWQVIDFLTPDADVGTPLAAQNSAATLSATGNAFRLRLLLGDASAPLGEGTAFTLEYAPLSGSCAASSYSPVSSTTPIAFNNINSLNDGMQLTADSNDPTDGGNTIDDQAYVESNATFTNAYSIIHIGEDGEWDFSLIDNDAPASTTYCFEAVNSDGSALNSYSVYPEITTSDGAFDSDIVDQNGNDVASPSVSFTPVTEGFGCVASTGTLGTSTQKIRVINDSAGTAWTMSIAATNGNTSTWTDGANNYAYNDPSGLTPGCTTGNGYSFAGLLSLATDNASYTPETGCSDTGLVLGSDSYFNQGVTDSLTLGSAGSNSENGCYWDLEDLGLTQQIPALQPPGNYSLNFTITLVAN